MNAIRERFQFCLGVGSVPEYVVEYRDERGQIRDAVFTRKIEADRFAVDQASAGMISGNRAMLNRIAGRGGPKNLPRTLQVVLNRLAGTMQTREG